jgi:hypothetical protein
MVSLWLPRHAPEAGGSPTFGSADETSGQAECGPFVAVKSALMRDTDGLTASAAGIALTITRLMANSGRSGANVCSDSTTAAAVANAKTGSRSGMRATAQRRRPRTATGTIYAAP